MKWAPNQFSRLGRAKLRPRMFSCGKPQMPPFGGCPSRNLFQIPAEPHLRRRLFSPCYFVRNSSIQHFGLHRKMLISSLPTLSISCNREYIPWR